MRQALLLTLGAIPLLTGSALAADDEAAPSGGPAGATYSGPVTEIAIRLLSETQDPAEFGAARDAFVALLTSQPGVGTDREFAAIIDGATFGPPASPVLTGMTQYDSLAAFGAAAETLGSSPEAEAFLGTFAPLLFTALRPKDAAETYDLAAIAAGSGQLLEVAARDLSSYEDFDAAAYEAGLEAFLADLSQQPGFVAEYQWVSVLDPNIVVGMTVYESAEAFGAIAQDEAFLASAMPFITAYPPLTGYVHVDARQ